MRLQSQVLWKGWPPGIPALQLRGSPGPDDGGGARCSWPMADLLPLFCVCFVKGWGSLDLCFSVCFVKGWGSLGLCFSVCFVKGWGSLGLCFSLFLLPISEEETIKRRRPIVQFMEEPKKSQFLGCRHLEDKLVFLFADTLKTSWYSLLFISVWLCPNLRFLSLVKGIREDELDCWQFDEVVYSWRGPWL